MRILTFFGIGVMFLSLFTLIGLMTISMTKQSCLTDYYGNKSAIECYK